MYVVKAVLYGISSACLSQCGLAQYSIVCLLSFGMFHTNLSLLVSRLVCAGHFIDNKKKRRSEFDESYIIFHKFVV